MTMTVLKQVRAVLVGFISVVALSHGMDALLRALGVLPSVEVAIYPVSALVLALVYRSFFAVVGGYVTATLAQQNAPRLLTVLGCLGTLGGVAGVAVGWNMPNLWYPIGLLIGAFPLTWFGGKFKLTKQAGTRL
jgi:hypothetical protein